MSENEETLLEFPCDFPIKVMGKAEPGFEAMVVELVSRHTGELLETAINSRLSKGGKWVSVTITLRAESKAQLDAIYLDLTAHEKVVMAL
jgi:putative lipoic acid-binding regulatory protein